MSVRDELYSKVSCCFADKVYDRYLQLRYGVNNCKKINMEEMEAVNRLKNLFHFKTLLQSPDYLDRTNTYKNECTDVCNISSIIEKIRLL